MVNTAGSGDFSGQIIFKAWSDPSSLSGALGFLAVNSLFKCKLIL